jgi:clan AA aspartic protease (TIGR02281 family)
MPSATEPEFQLACPVCSAFNPSDFRFCPHCGHRLGAPDLVRARPRLGQRLKNLLRPVLIVILLLVVVGLGLERGLQDRISHWFISDRATDSGAFVDLLRQPPSVPDDPSPEPLGRGSEGEAIPPAARPVESTKPAAAMRQALTGVVELTLYDREGDRLRQVRAILTGNERRVVSTFENIRGAYSATVGFPNNRSAPVTGVERADATANSAILSLEPSPPSGNAPLRTLEGIARVTYEDTPAEHLYLAEKRAKAQRWEEALGHWKRAIEQDSSLRREHEAALAEAFLNASAVALQQERPAEAHARLLEAVDWLPEHGGIRFRLGQSYARLGDYREAIEHYWLALDLLPARATEVAEAIVRVYHDWGQTLLKQGDFAAAAGLFREALQLDSTNGGLYWALGLAEFRRQAFEAAIQAFENAIAYEPGLRGEVESYLAEARAFLGGPNTVVIAFPPGSTRIEIPVVINSRIQVPFIVDTGATMTLIPTWAAEMLGYRPQASSEWLRVQTAGGTRRLPYAALSRIEIQGLGLSDLPVLFGDLPGYDATRGLLGMDFLRHFSLAVDHDVGRMTLRLR